MSGLGRFGLPELVAQPRAARDEVVEFDVAAADPERTMAQREILQLVERATDNLPEIFRIVFMTRVIEGMSIEETADLLGLQPETVKTRLHRARRLVREELDKQIGPVLMDAFPFAGRRCERMIASSARTFELIEMLSSHRTRERRRR
jgi:RNA polymerase sigma-70 factor (ECF subfamily)